MATHFQGRFEVEFKYRLTDSAAFVHTLTALSPEVMVADNHEQDCYFDTADGALARAEKSLIIRTMAPSGIRLWIVKGPGPDRCEAVNITDADKAISMVRTLEEGTAPDGFTRNQQIPALWAKCPNLSTSGSR